jgi:Iron/manganese superoxide dismutases, C-terminal domain
MLWLSARTRFWQHNRVVRGVRGLGKGAGVGSGWAILAWPERLGRLVNQWAADYAHGLPAASPILAIDMYEHAYHQDFGAKAAAYVDQVMVNLNWKRIGMRYRWATGEGKNEDELFDPLGRMIGQSGEQIGEPGARGRYL